MNVSSAVGIARDSFFAEGDKSGQEVVFGPKSIDQLGSRALSLGRRVLLVTDAGLTAAGHPQRVMELLESEGLKVTLFDQSIENPTDSSVQACAEVARDAEIDLIVGLGGGSSMDTAKGCNFILTNGGSMADYWGIGKAKNSMFPLVAVPTTAGTGSECQSFAPCSIRNSLSPNQRESRLARESMPWPMPWSRSFAISETSFPSATPNWLLN